MCPKRNFFSRSMASACRAAAAALVKSFPPAVAAPFCTLVGDVLLHQHAGYRGICWRKTFQESPRKARSSASARHGEARRGTGSLAAPRHLARALLKRFPPTDAAKLSMLSQNAIVNQHAEGRGDGWGKTFHQGRRHGAAGARHGPRKTFFSSDTLRHNDNTRKAV